MCCVRRTARTANVAQCVVSGSTFFVCPTCLQAMPGRTVYTAQEIASAAAVMRFREHQNVWPKSSPACAAIAACIGCQDEAALLLQISIMCAMVCIQCSVCRGLHMADSWLQSTLFQAAKEKQAIEDRHAKKMQDLKQAVRVLEQRLSKAVETSAAL